MRFHEEIKNSLSLFDEIDISETEAVLYGILACQWLKPSEKNQILCVKTSLPSVARYVFRLFNKAFVCKGKVRRVESAAFGGHAEYTVEITDSSRVLEIQRYYGLEGEGNFVEPLIADESLKKAFLRGVFLICGYCTDPQRAYLVEFRLQRKKFAIELKGLLAEVGIEFALREKNKRFILYAKNAEAYATTLALIGANSHYLKAEGSLAMKEMKNRLKRAVNCDTANLNKSVESSLRQIESILSLKKSGKYESLPDDLKIAAELRMSNELGSLSELADSSGNLAKSTIWRRLNKLVEISKGRS